jgi:hypothetical protein
MTEERTKDTAETIPTIWQCNVLATTRSSETESAYMRISLKMVVCALCPQEREREFLGSILQLCRIRNVYRRKQLF